MVQHAPCPHTEWMGSIGMAFVQVFLQFVNRKGIIDLREIEGRNHIIWIVTDNILHFHHNFIIRSRHHPAQRITQLSLPHPHLRIFHLVLHVINGKVCNLSVGLVQSFIELRAFHHPAFHVHLNRATVYNQIDGQVVPIIRQGHKGVPLHGTSKTELATFNLGSINRFIAQRMQEHRGYPCGHSSTDSIVYYLVLCHRHQTEHQPCYEQ